MKYKIPESIQLVILNKCKSGKGILELREPSTQQMIGRLEFDEDGLSRTITSQVSIIGYIERMLTFARKDVIILVDEIPLDQLNTQVDLIEHKNDAG